MTLENDSDNVEDMERVDLAIWRARRLNDSAARKRRSKKKRQEDREKKHRDRRWES